MDSTQENQSISPLMSMREFDDSIETAFQLATFKGPLCAEPMSGLCFSIERLEIHGDDLAASVKTSQFLPLFFSLSGTRGFALTEDKLFVGLFSSLQVVSAYR